MKVVIKLSNIFKKIEIKIDEEKNLLIANGKTIKIDVSEYISRLQTIISSWDERMINNGVLDGEEYSVKLKVGNKIREYVGKNSFPNNYRNFIKLINEVVPC